MHQQLQIGWTPELIAGRLKRQDKMPSVCHEAIYQYIYDLASHLIRHLPRHYAKRKRKRPYRKAGEPIKNRTGVALRPLAANARANCGHWETDMIVAGNRQHGLNVLLIAKAA